MFFIKISIANRQINCPAVANKKANRLCKNAS